MIIRFRDEMETRIRNALAISKRAVENYHGKIIGISGEVSQIEHHLGNTNSQCLKYLRNQ